MTPRSWGMQIGDDPHTEWYATRAEAIRACWCDARSMRAPGQRLGWYSDVSEDTGRDLQTGGVCPDGDDGGHWPHIVMRAEAAQ